MMKRFSIAKLYVLIIVYYSKIDQWHLMQPSVNEYDQVIIDLCSNISVTRTFKIDTCHNERFITSGGKYLN